MSTPMPTPRTDAAWAQTFQDDDDQCRAGNAATDMRDECATLERELAALTTERDQLRATIAEMPTCRCGLSTDDQCELTAKLGAATAERDQLRDEVERLTKQAVFDGDHIHTLNAAFATRAEVTDANARAERAEAELTTEREKSERYRLATLKFDAELAAERARLDSGTILLIVAGERVWHCGVDLRAAIDAAMKESAK